MVGEQCCSEGNCSDAFEAVWYRRLHYSVQFFDIDQLTPLQSQHIFNASVLFYLYDDVSKTEATAKNIQALFARCQNGHPSLIVLENLCGDDDLVFDEEDRNTEVMLQMQKRLLRRLDRDVPIRVISMAPLVRYLRRSLEKRLHEKWQAYVYDHFQPEIEIEKLDAVEPHEDPIDQALNFLISHARLRTKHNIGPYFVQYTQEELKSLVTPPARGVCAVGRIVCVDSSSAIDS